MGFLKSYNIVSRLLVTWFCKADQHLDTESLLLRLLNPAKYLIRSMFFESMVKKYRQLTFRCCTKNIHSISSSQTASGKLWIDYCLLQLPKEHILPRKGHSKGLRGIESIRACIIFSACHY